MEKTQSKAVERVTVTELRLTAEDVVAALRRGNGKMFKDAEVTVAASSAGQFTPADVLIVTITQTVKRQAK